MLFAEQIQVNHLQGSITGVLGITRRKSCEHGVGLDSDFAHQGGDLRGGRGGNSMDCVCTILLRQKKLKILSP